MLQSKEHMSYSYSLDFHQINSISLFWKTCLSELLLLVTPTDTSVQIQLKKTVSPRSKADSVRCFLKVVFWVIISLMGSIALGQLN